MEKIFWTSQVIEVRQIHAVTTLKVNRETETLHVIQARPFHVDAALMAKREAFTPSTGSLGE